MNEVGPRDKPSIAESGPARALVDYAREQTERAAAASPGAPSHGAMAVPGYEIIEEVHSGGQGVVFRAIQRATGKQVAVKALRGGVLAGASDRARFEREVRILSELDHPNVVGIRDSVEVDGQRFLVMDFVEGEPLDSFIRREQKSLKELLSIFATVCEAVHAAHGRGVIHRDLKPSNIRVAKDGTPFVLDFGSAKVGGDAFVSFTGPAAVTVTGHFVGSLPWASPEQADGGAVDERSDTYSLGVMLYQLLTGRFPYDVHGSMQEVLENIRRTEPTRPRSISRSLDDEVETILLRCLEKEPGRRYGNAGELAKDLRRYLAGEPIGAKRDSAWYVLTKRIRRYRVAVAVSAMVAGVSLAAAVTMTIFYRDKSRAEQSAVARSREVGAMDAFLNAMLRSVNSRSDAEELKFVDLLAKGEEYIGTNLQGQPLVEANLRTKLGDAYKRLRLHDESERHLKVALEIRQRELDPSNLETLMAMDRLASLYNDIEKLDKAEPLYRTTLTALRALFPEDHPHIVWKKMYLADVLEKQQKLDEADGLYREALESFTRAPGDDYRNYFDAANNYLVFLTDKNRIAQAEPLARGAVELLTRHVGPEDPKTKHMLSNHARVLTRVGHLEDSAAIYRRLIDDHVRQYGDKKAAGAIVMYLINLGEILLDQHRLPEAESLLRQAVALMERETGPEDRTLLLAKGNLACALSRKGAVGEAEELAREVLDTTRRFLGDRGGEAAEAEALLGEILSDAGNVEDAESLLARAVPVLEAKFGASDKATLQALACWGRTEQALGQSAHAEAILRRAVEAGRGLPASHWLRACLQSDLGCLLSELDRPTEAEAELVSAVAVLTETLGAEHPRTQRCLERLVSVYEDLERTAEAGRYSNLLRK